ncbi:MAG TPA: hypothetical protein VMH23_16920 [Bacteroidota bacterium]|nr:hypothetical protein [Bacteroidota bacterium]
MYPKTDSPEFARGFLWQLVILTIVVLVTILYFDQLFRTGRPDYGVERPRVVLLPYMLAGAHTIENGLAGFSGKPSLPVNVVEKIRILVGLFVVAILCPTFFLMNWRRRNLPGTEPGPWSMARLFYSLCGALVLYFAVASVPIAVFGEVMHQNLRERQAEQSNRDAIINELNDIAIDLYQYYILPKDMNGGNHSFMGKNFADARLKTSEGAYTITISDQSAAIRAESIRFPSSWVEVHVDSTGRMAGWIYGGKFL